jgi:hypothetical protein
MNDYFFHMRPAYPWSVEPVGLPALAAVAGLLVAFTIWSYTGHPNATRRRILTVVALRLLALVVALLTALRPSLGVQENPKVPSVLLVSIDVSESMTVKDEVNSQARIEAVRRVMEKCQPIIEELEREHAITTTVYKFANPDFSDASRYTPGDPADGRRSDYGTMLNRLYERWQGERFVRAVLVVGDGQNNGQTYATEAEARKFGQRGVPVYTFTVGSNNTDKNAQDIAVTNVECDPSPAAIKTEVTAIANVNAHGFQGTRVTAQLLIDGQVVGTEDFTLDKEKDNKLRMTFQAPLKPGEVKVTLRVGQLRDGQIVPISGELSGENNQSETYLTITKDGVLVLVIDSARPDEMRIRDVLRSEKRFRLNEVLVQIDGQVSAAGEAMLDLDSQAYDVIIIGNVSPDQLTFRRGDKPVAVLDKVREHVLKRGTGLIFLGGERAFRGYPDDLLPVRVPDNPAQAIVENVDPQDGIPKTRYQTIPTEDGLDTVMRLAKVRSESIELWGKVNDPEPRARITGYNKMFAKDGALVLAWASPQEAVIRAGTRQPANADPLLVMMQQGEGARGRILAFGAYDTYLWEKLGQPKSFAGSEIYAKFWKQCVLWLAHQEDEEGQAYIHPAKRQLKVGEEQTLRGGVKLPAGAKPPPGSDPNSNDDPNAELTVKVVPMPKSMATDPAVRQKEIEAALAKAPPETVVRDARGAKVLYRPRADGEYFVELTSPKKDANGMPVLDDKGNPVILRATAKFIAIPDVSDEMLKVNAEHEFLASLSVPNGGKALRLEDLPGFLNDLKAQKDFGPKPRPKYYPDWRRAHSRGFLPLWLVVFVLLLGTEWGLRRLWGMV